MWLINIIQSLMLLLIAILFLHSLSPVQRVKASDLQREENDVL